MPCAQPPGDDSGYVLFEDSFNVFAPLDSFLFGVRTNFGDANAGFWPTHCRIERPVLFL